MIKENLEKQELQDLRWILFAAANWLNIIKDKERHKELSSIIYQLTKEVNAKLAETLYYENSISHLTK